MTAKILPFTRLRTITSQVNAAPVNFAIKAPPFKRQSLSYYAALGAHIAMLRKAQGLTQGELARAIGVSQQAVFAYEVGERRISLFIMIRVARILATSLEALAGVTAPPREVKRRLSPRAMRHAARIQALSKTKQRFLIRILDHLEAGQVPWSVNQHTRKAA